MCGQALGLVSETRLDWTRNCLYFLYPSLGGVVDGTGAIQKHDLTPSLAPVPICSRASLSSLSVASSLLTAILVTIAAKTS